MYNIRMSSQESSHDPMKRIKLLSKSLSIDSIQNQNQWHTQRKNNMLYQCNEHARALFYDITGLFKP